MWEQGPNRIGQRRCNIWGVHEICYADEQYLREHQAREKELEPVAVIAYREERIPRSEPLKTLVARMRRPSPPALDLLIQTVLPPEDFHAFLRLLREYLPDSEKEIMELAGVGERMYAFAEAFSSIYFPLYTDWLLEDEGVGYKKLTQACPAVFHAFSSEDYAEIAHDEDRGDPEFGEVDEVLRVLAYVVENPWDSDDRAAFAEAASNVLPKKLLHAIPPRGFPINRLATALKGTDFEPVSFWAKVITQRTSNEFFDCGDMEDSGVEFIVSWDRPTIDALTRKYQATFAWLKKWHNFTDWFDEDLQKNTYNLVKILKERIKMKDAEKGEDLGSEAETLARPDHRQGRLLNSGGDGAGVADAPGPEDSAG